MSTKKSSCLTFVHKRLIQPFWPARASSKNFFLLKTFLLLTLIFLPCALLAPQLAWSAVNLPQDAPRFLNFKDYTLGPHGRLACQECHGDMQENGIDHFDPDREDFLQRDALRSFDYSECKRCHETVYQRYLQGGHAQALDKEQIVANNKLQPDKDAEDIPPVCGNCHDVHEGQPGLDRVEIGRRQTEVCGSCHPEHVQTYLKTTHGKIAVNLGNEDGAYCTDCHGAHNVDSLQDKEANLKACQRCHTDIEERFTDIIMHSGIDFTAIQGTKNEEDIKGSLTIINVVRVVVIVIVVAVISFFFLHTLLHFLREYHERLRNK